MEIENNNTGAEIIKRAISIIALTGVVLAGSAFIDCKTHKSTTGPCLVAIMEEKIFDQDTALRHIAEDLQDERNVENIVVNYKGMTYYDIPSSFEFVEGADDTLYGYREVNVHETVQVDEQGNEKIIYSLPSGGILAKDENGQLYGYQRINPVEGTYDRTVVSFDYCGVTDLFYYNDQGELVNTIYEHDSNTPIYNELDYSGHKVRTNRLTK